MKSTQSLGRDLSASLVVFLVALPLCLGIAIASDAPPLSGIIAGIVGGLLVGSLSGSRLGVSGPAAGLAVIVAEAITGLGFETFLLAAVIAGVLQLLLGVLRAGVVAYFFPNSVIKGMLAGIGVIIFLKQLPHAVGYDKDPEGDLFYDQPDGETTSSELVKMLDYINPAAIVITLVGIALILAFQSSWVKRNAVFKHIPGQLMAVLAGVGLYFAFAKTGWAISAEHTIAVPVVSSLSEAKSLIIFPNWAGLTNPAVWTTAATIAIVASIETLLCVEATDKMDPHRRITPVNRELLAQGAGNVLSAIIGGLPVTQVIVRSSANLQAGAVTKASAVMHGLWLAVAVLVFPVAMNYIPMASLAAILIVVGYKLAHPSNFAAQYRRGWGQFAPFVATVVAIYFTDLLTGIGIGLAISIIFLLLANYRTPYFSGRRSHQDGETLVLELSEHVSFLNKARIQQTLNEVPDNSKVVVDGRRAVVVDPDVEDVFADFSLHAADRGIQFAYLGPDSSEDRGPALKIRSDGQVPVADFDIR